MVLNPFLTLLCQRLECRNIGGHNTGVSLYTCIVRYINNKLNNDHRNEIIDINNCIK